MKRRASGILLHITSLPSLYGIGDLGPWAYRFSDFLAHASQGFWQILPLNPTSLDRENSPYSSSSSLATNPLFISPDLLVRDGILARTDLARRPDFPDQKVDYKAVTAYKSRLLDKANQNCRDHLSAHSEFQRFCRQHSAWLEDHALFISLRSHFDGAVWNDWPLPLRDRHSSALKAWRRRLHDPILKEKFVQYLFFKQWEELKGYCNRHHIRIIGDIPIYVQYNSTDVWAHPEIFKLTAQKDPVVVSGIPPDYFSATGQLWGNPIYRWDVLKRQGFSWWTRRLAHNLKLFDVVRLDHFKGFVDYWEVPAKARTAIKGKWRRGPGEAFFRELLEQFPSLPLIAEDLGVITPEVQRLLNQFELPGMRVLQFAFGSDPLADLYKPHSYIPNCVAYTGTHDNDTLMGWLYGSNDYSTRRPDEIRMEQKNALQYLGVKGTRPRGMHWEFIRLLMMSAANLVIFPLQDVLGLGNEARINCPGKPDGNWEWRLSPTQFSTLPVTRLAQMTEIYGRAPRDEKA